MPEEIGFWLAVGVVSVVSVVLFKALVAQLGDTVPGLRDLAAFI